LTLTSYASADSLPTTEVKVTHFGSTYKGYRVDFVPWNPGDEIVFCDLMNVNVISLSGKHLASSDFCRADNYCDEIRYFRRRSGGETIMRIYMYYDAKADEYDSGHRPPKKKPKATCRLHGSEIRCTEDSLRKQQRRAHDPEEDIPQDCGIGENHLY